MADLDRNPACGRQGWICPKCGSVYAPTWFECVRCKPHGSSGWAPNPSAVPYRFRSTSAPGGFDYGR